MKGYFFTFILRPIKIFIHYWICTTFTEYLMNDFGTISIDSYLCRSNEKTYVIWYGKVQVYPYAEFVNLFLFDQF